MANTEAGSVMVAAKTDVAVSIDKANAAGGMGMEEQVATGVKY